MNLVSSRPPSIPAKPGHRQILPICSFTPRGHFSERVITLPSPLTPVLVSCPQTTKKTVSRTESAGAKRPRLSVRLEPNRGSAQHLRSLNQAFAAREAGGERHHALEEKRRTSPQHSLPPNARRAKEAHLSVCERGVAV